MSDCPSRAFFASYLKLSLFVYKNGSMGKPLEYHMTGTDAKAGIVTHQTDTI